MRPLFQTSYAPDINLFRDRFQACLYLALLSALALLPFLLSDYLTGELTGVLIWAIAGMGLMLLAGHSGQASLGHAAFMAVGAFACILFQQRLGLPFILALPLSAFICALVGLAIARPLTQLQGLYLAVATLVISVLLEDIIVLAEPLTGGVTGLFPPDISIFGISFNRYAHPDRLYWLTLCLTILVTLAYRNLLRSPTGRAFVAIRDSELSAQAMGIPIARTRALAFALSCAITGIAGALMGHFAGIVNHETFNIFISINLLMMIVIGGLGSIHGAFFGALIIGLLPQIIALARDGLARFTGTASLTIPGLDSAIFAIILIIVILFEPTGIYGRWVKIRTWFDLFPFYRANMFARQQAFTRTERLK